LCDAPRDGILKREFYRGDTLSIEAQLVERAKAQDEAAFEQIMRFVR
jgi:hypothetical protein